MADEKEETKSRIDGILSKLKKDQSTPKSPSEPEDKDIASGKKIGQAVKDAGDAAVQKEQEQYRRQVREAGDAAVQQKRGIKTKDYIMPRQGRERPQTKNLRFLDFALFFIIIAIQYWDYRADFGRTPQLLAMFFAMYTFIAAIATAVLKHDDEEYWPAFLKHYWPAALFATLWPRILGFLFSLVPQGLGGTIVGSFSLLDILFVITTLLPVFAFMVYRNSKSFFVPYVKFWYGFWIFVTLIFIVSGQIQHIPGGTGVVFQGSNGVQEYSDFLKENFRVFFSNLAGFPSVVNVRINDSINRLYEPYFTGTVEDNKHDLQLGVYLENVKPLQDTIYPTDDKIVVYADVKAKSFTDEIVMKNTCFAIFKPEDPSIKEYARLQGEVDLDTLRIHDYESNQLVCTIDRQRIQTKDPSIKIEFRSSFNFITWGYMDMAFMERQDLFLRKKNINSQLGIPTTAKAIYTVGPLVLGMADSLNLPPNPTGIDTVNPQLPLFGVTLEAAPEYFRRGQLTKIDKLVFHVPRYMYLKDNSCNPINPSAPEQTEDGNFNLYTFTNVPVHEASLRETVRCRLGIYPRDINDFLGPGGIALTSFAVEAEYEYELTNFAFVKIAPPEATT
jgi:hypothetical protein